MKTGKLVYASSEKNSNILYLSGFSAVDPFTYFASGRKHGIIVSALEYARALNEVKNGIAVYEIEDFKTKEKEKFILEVTKRFPCDEWIIPEDFPYKIGEYLRKHNVRLKCKNETFTKKRRIKSDEEIKHITHALRITEKGMQKAVEILKASKIRKDDKLLYNKKILTSEILIREIETEIKKYGGNAQHTIASCGKHASEPHNSGKGPIFANKTIVIDIFPRGPKDYYGDMTRTFVKGKAPETVKRAFETVRKARDEAKKMIKSGITASSVHNMAAGIIKENGFKTEKIDGVRQGFFHGLGHGVGLDVHEAPGLNAKASHLLKSGDIVTVEPGVYYPEWGGIRLEDMVAVEKNGCKLLTRFPTFLEIK